MTIQEQMKWVEFITSHSDYCDEYGNPIEYSPQSHHVRNWLYAHVGNSGYQNKIPRHYSGQRVMRGVQFIVNASTSTPRNRKCTHRVFVVCPMCNETIPIGRFRQHAKRVDY